ncbi:MAG: DUF4398 domain-containing protein [Pseudomonadota bacterium]
MKSPRTWYSSAALLTATALLAAACESAPPVQEMSDARQAIAVAREAGAEAYATEELMRAERYLKSAEQKLGAEQYRDARRAALQAKSSALDATEHSEAHRADKN